MIPTVPRSTSLDFPSYRVRSPFYVLTGGGVPVQYLGEFTTNHRGRGRLHLRTESIHAFVAANQARENDLGIARHDNPDLPPPGVVDPEART